MRNLARLAWVSLLPILATACADANGSPPDASDLVGLEPVVSGLAFPLYLTAPPDDPRLFVVEKGGRIRIVKDGTLLPVPFLDVSALVSGGSE